MTDLDNTLWDWFELWHGAFRPFLHELVKVTGISEEALKKEIKAVHQRHRTAEYSHVLQELPSLQQRFGREFAPYHALPSVIEAYRAGRRQAYSVYPTVRETLKAIRDTGALIVGFTESQSFYTSQRVRVFDFDGVLDYLYTTEDHGLPSRDALRLARNRPDAFYELKKTAVRVLPTHAKKPDAKLLRSILEDVGCVPSKAIYVGDNLHKDVLMAKQAGVLAAHAAYGESHRDSRYQLLVDVTFWTEEDVEQQRKLKVVDVRPDFQLHAFSELLNVVRFVPFTPDVRPQRIAHSVADSTDH